jgi:hypothetical protein
VASRGALKFPPVRLLAMSGGGACLGSPCLEPPHRVGSPQRRGPHTKRFAGSPKGFAAKPPGHRAATGRRCLPVYWRVSNRSVNCRTPLARNRGGAGSRPNARCSWPRLPFARPTRDNGTGVVLCWYLCFGTHAAPAACAEKHITAWLMRVIYLPHERLGRHVSGADFHSVDAHRRRLGNSTCRWKRAVLLAQASRGSSPCQWRCQPLVVPAAGAELTLGRRRAL